MKELKDNVSAEYIRVIRVIFERYKSLGDKTFEQLEDKDFYYRTDEDSNSIAILIQHIGGNLISRFTDFLTTDGDKPNRNRDMEFEELNLSRPELLKKWEDGWQKLFFALNNLTEEDLMKTVTIRGEQHSVIEALGRAVTHCAYHVGQIILLAKQLKKSDWKTLSIPKKNKSKE